MLLVLQDHKVQPVQLALDQTRDPLVPRVRKDQLDRPDLRARHQTSLAQLEQPDPQVRLEPEALDQPVLKELSVQPVLPALRVRHRRLLVPLAPPVLKAQPQLLLVLLELLDRKEPPQLLQAQPDPRVFRGLLVPPDLREPKVTLVPPGRLVPKEQPQLSLALPVPKAQPAPLLDLLALPVLKEQPPLSPVPLDPPAHKVQRVQLLDPRVQLVLLDPLGTEVELDILSPPQ